MSLPVLFWRFAASSGASNLADGILQVALPLLALQLTRSPLLVAGVTVASRLPWVLLALPAGVVADRVDRRRLMLGVDLFRVAAIAVVTVLAIGGAVQLWHLYTLAFLLGTVETLFDTAAQSLLPTVVARSQLARANSRLFGVEVVANTFLGPPLGGVLAGLALATALSGGAVGYLVAALVLATVTGSYRPDRPGRTSVRHDLSEGLTYLWRHALLRRLALLVGGFSLTASAVFAVLPVYAVAPGPMGLSETEFGFFLTATGIGAVIASLTAERVEAALGRARSLRLAIVAGAATLASPLVVQPVAVAAAMALGAYFIVVWNVITVSLRQRLVPGRLLGRVNSAYRLLAWGTAPIGAVLGGWLAQSAGLPVTFVLSAVGTLALLLAMRPLNDRVLGDGE